MFTVIENPFEDISFDSLGQDVSPAKCRVMVRPSAWAEGHFLLPSEGYGEYGLLSFSGREWQRDILDAFVHYHYVLGCGPVQVGKSVSLVDVPWAWFQAVIGGRALLVYADKETVEDVFEEKLRPIIEQNLQDLWSGRDNDIRQNKIILRSGITRCASCNVQNDIATFAAKFVCCDEVSKWRSRFDAIGQAIGRTRDYWGAPGIDYRISIVSSPKEVNDPLYTQIYRPGVIIFYYLMPCPFCGHMQELRLENIEEVPPADGKKDHDPERIRKERAAEYHCESCNGIIHDTDRYAMLAKGRWEAEGGVYMVGGVALGKDGKPVDVDRVAFWFSRLISKPEKYPFYECLASYFEAKSSPDPNAYKNFWNEDLARFWQVKSGELTEQYLKARASDEYTVTGPIPDGVIVPLGGIDTQDDGFYFVIVGYGRYMECWVLRYGFIPCDMNHSEFKDPEKVRERFASQFYAEPLKYKDGRIVPVIFSLMDEGGHREKHVRYICRKHHDITPYKGVEKDAPLFRKSEQKRLWLCNKQSLSTLVEKDMESDTWHLPYQPEQEFIDQIRRQYTKRELDKNGNPRYVFVHGGEDHYRDCLNEALAAAYIMNLPGRLNNEQGISQVVNTVNARAGIPADAAPEKKPGATPDPPAARPTLPQRFHSPQNTQTQRSPFSNRPRIGRWR